MQSIKLFHVSEDAGIKIFMPRPSPSHFDNIKGDVVFAVAQKLLHNYLLPRDCPRVTFYTSAKTSQEDKEDFFGTSTADFVIAIEEQWVSVIQQTKLYVYEFSTDNFELLDDCAGYFISYKQTAAFSITCIDNIFSQLKQRSNVELRILPELWPLADKVAGSTLQFSLIRMRNAIENAGPNLSLNLRS